MIYAAIKNTLHQLNDLLNQLDENEYTMPVNQLSNATIGQHTRHIIELYQCLLNNYHTGIINYDKRQRDKQIETEIAFAKTCIKIIIDTMQQVDKDLLLEQQISDSIITIKTSYYRELLYNLEHCIHHQALIKVAVLNNNKIFVSENFGVAPSTVEFRKTCAQ